MPDIDTDLTRSVVEVLEAQGFIFVEAAAVAPEGESLHVCVGFEGRRGGRLGIVAAPAFAAELAANMLGLDAAALEPSSAADALGELANILCGQSLTARHGTDEVFRLGVPQFGAAPEDLSALETSQVLADDHPVLVYVEEWS